MAIRCFIGKQEKDKQIYFFFGRKSNQPARQSHEDITREKFQRSESADALKRVERNINGFLKANG